MLRDAIVEGRIDTSHGLMLMKASKGREIQIEPWIARVESEDLSVRQLARAIDSETGRPAKQIRYFQRLSSGAFHIYPLSYDPRRTPPNQRIAMITILKEALALLETPVPSEGGRTEWKGAC